MAALHYYLICRLSIIAARMSLEGLLTLSTMLFKVERVSCLASGNCYAFSSRKPKSA